MTTWITICDTCKRDGWDQGKMTRTDGEKLASLIEEIVVNSPVRTRRTSCMMGCKHGCNVAIQADEKRCYTIGNFEPSAQVAEAIVAYGELHAASKNGQVPYRQWPEALKGHFVTRHQPLPKDE